MKNTKTRLVRLNTFCAKKFVLFVLFVFKNAMGVWFKESVQPVKIRCF